MIADWRLPIGDWVNRTAHSYHQNIHPQLNRQSEIDNRQ